jgi:hypothetical protein
MKRRAAAHPPRHTVIEASGILGGIHGRRVEHLWDTNTFFCVESAPRSGEERTKRIRDNAFHLSSASSDPALSLRPNPKLSPMHPTLSRSARIRTPKPGTQGKGQLLESACQSVESKRGRCRGTLCS